MSLRRYFTRRPMLARPTHTPPSAAFAPRDPAPAVAPASASDTAPAPATASAVAVEEAPQAGPAPAALDLAFVLTPAAAPPAPAMAVEPPAAPAAPPPPTAVPVRVIERFAPPPRKFPFHKVRHHRPGDRPARPPASRTAVSAALLINLLSLAALGAAIYDRITEANSSENNLRADNTSFKLKTTSAMTRAVSEPRSSHSIEIPVIEEKTERLPPPVTSPEPELVAPPPVAPTQEPPVGGSPIGLPPVVVDPPPLLPVPMVPVVPMEPVAPPPAEPPLLVPVAAEPATQQLPTAERLWQPYLVSSRTYGETPMLRNWSMIKLASALAVSLAVTPASFAGEKENKDVKSILDRLEKMEKELPENVEKLIGKKLEGALLENFKILKKNLEKEIDELKSMVLSKDVAFGELERQVQRIASDLDKLRKRLPAEGNVALYPPDKMLEEIRTRLGEIEKALKNGTSRVALSPPATSRILFVNLHPEELLFIVNGKNYRVPPNATMPLENQTPGPLTYEVLSPTWGRRAMNTTTLNPGETFTLTAR